MSILLTALTLAAAAAAQPAPTAPADHAQHQPGQKHEAEGCCCKKMAGGNMDCCAKHGEGHAGSHQSAPSED